MRAALIVSVIAHVAVLQWVAMMPSGTPIELNTIEALPVDLVPIGEITDIAKGREIAEPEETPQVADVAPLEKPMPAAPEPPPPPPMPEEVAAPPEPELAAPEPEPPPPSGLPQFVAPPPEPEPPPPEPPPPPPEPTPAPEPPPPPPEPAEATPAPEPPPPAPVEQAEAPPTPAPVPKSRPRPPPMQAQEEPSPELSDKIAALLDRNRESPPQPSDSPASLGTRTGRDNAAMTQTEMDALAAKMRGCWSPPLGATGADELRTVVLIRLNRDGSLAGQPQIVRRPPGRYETTAPESVVRAIGRCAPYNLPLEKYAEWREIEFDFYPVDMF